MARTNKAVEKQAQLAEQMYNKIYGKTEETAPAPEEQPKVEEVAQQSEEVEQNAESAAPEPQPVEVQEVADQPVEVKENDAQQVKPKFPDADPNDPSWEQKYKVIANKYSAEVPRYAAEIRSLKAEIDELKQSLDKSSEAPKAEPKSSVKPEEVEEYGEKFVDFVKRAASDAVPSDVNELKTSVEEMRREQQVLARKRFFGELVELSPQWEQLNEDKAFLGWLGEIDPFSGQQRQVIFDDAYSKLDAWRVANFFNGYSESQKATEPPPPKPSLDSQITPKVTARTTTPPAKKVYSTTDVARFYDDMRRGKYSTEEAARIESDIFAAQAEGRFR
jgi:hypothetical protein